MTTYTEAIVEKNYLPNVVIFFKDFYWAIRQPDSGLVIEEDRLAVGAVAINPTKVDPDRVGMTINSYTFNLTDKNYAVTLLFNGITKFFQKEPVVIYIGRCGVDMDFADYVPLPTTYVSSVSKDGNSYNFSSVEAKDRLNRPAFNERNKLEVDILAATTEIDAFTLIDPTKYPAAGLIKIDDEYISYASIDAVNNRFSGCIRGEENTVPATHDAGSEIFLVTEIEANPIDIILQCMISSGGGGAYDVLPDGAGIDESLINVEAFEEIRDEFFLDHTYRFLVFGVTNILNFLETEILYANEVRIITDNTSKLSLALLNRRIFDVDFPTIDESSIDKQPSYTADDKDIINVVSVEYDYMYSTEKYLKIVTLQDDDSITDFGKRETKTIRLKGVLEVNDGLQIATDIAQRFLNRFSYPRPEISFSTHMDKSLVQLSEKILLSSNQLPNVDTGELNFADTVEVIERGINWKTGIVKFKVAFTSFTGIRECFLAPSDTILSFTSQKSLTIGAGRGSLYRPGWKLRLYSNVTREYVSSQVNEIASIAGDVVTFVDDWADTLFNTHRIMFADYDEVAELQRRYCFISDDGLNFSIDNKKSYQITL